MSTPTDRKQIALVIEYLDTAIAEMQRGYERDTAEHSAQWLAARNVLRMTREFCYTLDGQCEPSLDYAFALITSQTLELGGVGKAIEPVCTCHERDSSYACPVCHAAGHRGQMER